MHKTTIQLGNAKMIVAVDIKGINKESGIVICGSKKSIEAKIEAMFKVLERK